MRIVLLVLFIFIQDLYPQENLSDDPVSDLNIIYKERGFWALVEELKVSVSSFYYNADPSADPSTAPSAIPSEDINAPGEIITLDHLSGYSNFPSEILVEMLPYLQDDLNSIYRRQGESVFIYSKAAAIPLGQKTGEELERLSLYMYKDGKFTKSGPDVYFQDNNKHKRILSSGRMDGNFFAAGSALIKYSYSSSNLLRQTPTAKTVITFQKDNFTPDEAIVYDIDTNKEISRTLYGINGNVILRSKNDFPVEKGAYKGLSETSNSHVKDGTISYKGKFYKGDKLQIERNYIILSGKDAGSANVFEETIIDYRENPAGRKTKVRKDIGPLAGTYFETVKVQGSDSLIIKSYGNSVKETSYSEISGKEYVITIDANEKKVTRIVRNGESIFPDNIKNPVHNSELKALLRVLMSRNLLENSYIIYISMIVNESDSRNKSIYPKNYKESKKTISIFSPYGLDKIHEGETPLLIKAPLVISPDLLQDYKSVLLEGGNFNSNGPVFNGYEPLDFTKIPDQVWNEFYNRNAYDFVRFVNSLGHKCYVYMVPEYEYMSKYILRAENWSVMLEVNFVNTGRVTSSVPYYKGDKHGLQIVYSYQQCSDGELRSLNSISVIEHVYGDYQLERLSNSYQYRIMPQDNNLLIIKNFTLSNYGSPVSKVDYRLDAENERFSYTKEKDKKVIEEGSISFYNLQDAGKDLLIESGLAKERIKTIEPVERPAKKPEGFFAEKISKSGMSRPEETMKISRNANKRIQEKLASVLDSEKKDREKSKR